MNPSDGLSLEQRAVDKFYTRIRIHLDDIEPRPEPEKKPLSNKLKDLKEEEKYGVIRRVDMERLLLNYDETSDRPTRCDGLVAGTYAKLLYSQSGFHNPSSTDYLVEDLNIKERNRDSFLGGHSTYDTPEDSSLSGILKHHTKLYIMNRARELLDEMDEETTDHDTLEHDVKELLKIDSGNCYALLVSGRYLLRKKCYQKSLDDLQRALSSDCEYIGRIRKYMSEAFFQLGMDFYSRNIYQEASVKFRESIDQDPDHQGSNLHIGMCMRKVQEQNRRFGEHSNTFTQRRR